MSEERKVDIESTRVIPEEHKIDFEIEQPEEEVVKWNPDEYELVEYSFEEGFMILKKKDETP